MCKKCIQLRCTELSDVIRCDAGHFRLTNTCAFCFHPTFVYTFSNRFTEVPAVVGKLRKLRRLTMDQNDISRIGDSLMNLTKLEKLEMIATSITIIPEVDENPSNNPI